MSCDLSGSAHDVIAELAWIAKIGDLPAIKVVVCTENLSSGVVVVKAAKDGV